MKTRLLALCVFFVLALGHDLALAARAFTYSQTPSPASAQFDMGSTQSLSYLITNTNTNIGTNNTGERIFTVRIRISSGSTFTAATVAPAGWTLTTRTTTTATYRANAWANAIAAGASQSFTVVVLMRTSTTDINDKLRDIRSSYTTSTTFATTAGTVTSTIAATPAPPTQPSVEGQWKLVSLIVTMQITDLSGVPIGSVAAGNSFRVVMTVTNKSTAAQNGITSNPNPPTQFRTGTTAPVLTGTVGSPLNLAAGGSGTITFTYSTSIANYGTVYFTAAAQRISTVTSASAISPTLTVVQCVFSAGIAASDYCLYPGQNVSVTMLLTNACASAVNTVTATLATTGPATLVSGPTPATIASIAGGGGTASVGWVYQVNAAAATNPFTFTGSATSASPALTTAPAASPSIQRGDFGVTLSPNVTNASSTNVELSWNVINSNGCAAANSVAITFPAGWVSANDAYSLVNLNATTAIETWIASGANPVTFTAPNVASRLPLGFDGNFNLLFSATPAVSGSSIFTVNVTDAGGDVVSVPVSVTVNPFQDADGLNSVINSSWRELFP